MNITQIKKADIKPDYWSGGKTFQYCIYPENAQYADKDFDFRISSATIESEPSVFTRFEGYQRYLLMLDNALKIQRNGIIENYQKNEILKFDSFDKVESYSTGNDFNLMIKKDIDNVYLQVIQENEFKNAQFLFAFALTPSLLKINNQSFALDISDCILINNTNKKTINLQSNAPVIAGSWL